MDGDGPAEEGPRRRQFQLFMAVLAILSHHVTSQLNGVPHPSNGKWTLETPIAGASIYTIQDEPRITGVSPTNTEVQLAIPAII